MTDFDIGQLTLNQIREVAAVAGCAGASGASVPAGDRHPLEGQNVFIRTVTHYYTGKMVRSTAMDLVLEDAAWIADTARLGQALVSGEFSEVEPYPGGTVVGRGAVVDVCAWPHALPRKVK